MIRQPAFRGQPLVLLGAVLGAWCALRVATFAPLPPLPVPASLLAPALPVAAARPAPPEPPAGARAVPGPETRGLPYAPAWPTEPLPPPALAERAPPLAGFVPAVRGAPAIPPGRGAIGHSLLLLAGLSRASLPLAALGYGRGGPRAAPFAAPPVALAAPERRWAADGWALLREGGAGSPAAAQPSYGRSQAGAVLRYRLAPASRHRPEAYVRATAALAGPAERQVAAGLSARPLPRVPVRVAAELRADEGEVRPAAFAVTELAPVALAQGIAAEAYGQAGWVGGEGATAFVDGQARVTARVARLGDGELAGGAGAWGGAQQGAARLDVGPTASLDFRLGETRARIAADYRVRVAGEAEPGSGAALTLSAGF